MASPDSRRANELTGLLFGIIDGYISTRGLGGRVYLNRFAFQLNRWNAPEPDVAYVSQERLHLIREGRMDGAPDIAVEIVTRDSRERDYVTKRRLYEQHGLGEYWLVDAIQRKVDFLRLNDERQYEDAAPGGTPRFESRQIPGLWIETDWLTSDEVPRAWDCLRQVLEG